MNYELDPKTKCTDCSKPCESIYSTDGECLLPPPKGTQPTEQSKVEQDAEE